MKTKRYNGEDSSYTGDDPIVKYRMGMIDDKGNDITKPASRDFDTTDSETPSMDLTAPKAVEKTVVKTKVSAPKDSVFKSSSWDDSSKVPETKKPSSLPRGQQKASEFLKRSMDQIGQEGRDQEARYKATQAAMKASGLGLSPRMKAARMSNPTTTMKKGGSVSSASKRADGCATKGKTRGKMC